MRVAKRQQECRCPSNTQQGYKQGRWGSKQDRRSRVAARLPLPAFATPSTPSGKSPLHTSTSLATSPSTLQQVAISSSLREGGSRPGQGGVVACGSDNQAQQHLTAAAGWAQVPREQAPPKPPAGEALTKGGSQHRCAATSLAHTTCCSPDDQRGHQADNVALAGGDDDDAAVAGGRHQRARHLMQRAGGGGGVMSGSTQRRGGDGEGSGVCGG